MRGLELMLMSLYTVMQNETNYTDHRPPENNGVLDINKLGVSIADVNLKNGGYAKPTELKVTTWQHMPYSGFKNVSGNLVGEGYAFDILHLVQRKMNFTYTIIPPDSSEIGDATSGIMGLLYHQKVDLAVAFVPMLMDLTKLCTFSTIMDEAEITFLMKRPSESATGQGILAPFNNTVWICILIAWIFFGPTMYILILIRSRMSRSDNPEAYSLPTCIWFTYGALLKQGTTSEPITNSTRLLFAAWWIFIIILTSFYTANLTAFLTLSEFTLPYNNAKDIAQKHQKWVSLKHHTLNDVLHREHSEILDPLKKSISRKEGMFTSMENSAIFEWLRKGRIFLGDKNYIAKMIAEDYQTKTAEGIEETQRCTYVMLPNSIYVISRAFAHPPNSIYREEINKHLMHVVETGIVKHLKTKNLPSVNICPLNLKSKERRLRNADLTMTYKVMAAGFILASLMFLGEVIYRFILLEKCGKLCTRGIACCCRREKKIAPILPIHATRMHDERRLYTKQNSYGAFENHCNQHGIGKNVINGREYWVIKEKGGDRRLVPIRTPSALLFQYITKQ